MTTRDEVANRLEETSTAVDADDIQWTLAPLPTVSLLELSDEDVAVRALVESESYRALAQEGIHRLHAMARQLARLQTTNRALREELRRYTRQQVGGPTC